MRPAVGQVLHFSEDPAIERFVPHVAATAREAEAYVWAVDAEQAPSYWFPRQCPRAMAWVRPGTTDADRERIVGAGCGERVHAIEFGWLDAMRSTILYAYRLPAGRFRPFGEPWPHAWVAVEPVEPLGPPEPVGDLLACHAAAGIQVRLLDSLWPFWDEVITSSLGFSGIRLHNARPADA
ncbi:hypothetical protein AMIS_73900 [Actinoplanes missouriensis 431]|uniref:Uncharacterized protein n=1 Tax=Actinoplanes missouriensis (strain ATCC 14538 / DSM 43046 / CBS 188.64 / JCM 3121 / NBRC 102363 / NCIMB 12654 / NRRL B-3342 / UNCC 431) TaxID=512565 RepID=I0HHX3_ACTM4|nr:DUF6886 family protein [Actinoplanes missouriensis]BAL92610.1 hypothetical protein AMIS_73900 [Actinoplanes missouriensis 431]